MYTSASAGAARVQRRRSKRVRFLILLDSFRAEFPLRQAFSGAAGRFLLALLEWVSTSERLAGFMQPES